MTGLKSELARKAFHVSMGGFAFLLRWLTPLQAASLAAGALAFNLFGLNPLTHGALLRDGERERGFSAGIVLYPAVVLALILIFHRRLELAAAVWALLAFGDGMATVGGVLLRGPRLPWNPHKTWVGLVTFVLYGTATSALLIRWTQQAALDAVGRGAGASDAMNRVGLSFLDAGLGGSPPRFLLLGCLAAALAAAVAESMEIGIDDNLVVPLVGGSVLYAATLVEPQRLSQASELIGANLAWGAAVNTLLAAAAYAARGVGRSGAIWGWVLGTTLYTFGGWRGFLMLVLFFVLGTASTKLGFSRKAALGIAQEKGGRRGAGHAFANTGVGVLCAFLGLATPYPELWTLALVAAFATAAFDTVSSEIGQAFGRRHYLVTTFRRVAAGTDGAVSPEGTLAGVAGALVLAAAAWGVGLIAAPAIPVAVAAAFLGATAESYLGATLERLQVVGNQLINFANTAIGAAAAVALHLLLR